MKTMEQQHRRSSVDHMCACVCVLFHHMIVVQIAKYTHLCWLCAIKFQVNCRSTQRQLTYINTKHSVIQCFLKPERIETRKTEARMNETEKRRRNTSREYAHEQE